MAMRRAILNKGNVVLFLYFSIIAIIIMLIAAVPTYYMMTNRLKQDIDSSDEVLLKQIKTGVDLVLQQSDRISIRMTMNSSLAQIVSKNRSSLYNTQNYDPEVLGNLSKSIFSEKDSYQFINSVYIYLPNSGAVFVNYSMYDIKNFDDSKFIESILSTSAPRATGLIGPRVITRSKSSTASMPMGNVISLYRRFNYSGSPNSPVLVVVNLKIDALKQLVQEDGGERDLQFYLVNDKGDIVLSTNAHDSGNLISEGLDSGSFNGGKTSWEQSFDNQKMLVTSVSSDYNNWRYITMIPQAAALAPINETQKYVIVPLLVCLVIGLALALIFSRRYYSPIRRLIQSIIPNNNAVKTSRNEFELLDSVYRSLASENIHNKDIIKDNWNVIKDKFITDVLNGNCSINESIPQQVEFRYGKFRVICIERDDIYKFVENLSETDKSLVLHNMERIASEMFGVHSDKTTVITAKISDKRVAVLVNFDDIFDDGMLNDTLVALQERIRTQMDFTCTIGVGNVYYVSDELPVSYIEAKNALKYKVFFRSDSIIYYNKINEYEFSNFDEAAFTGKKQALIESIKAKNPEAAGNVLDEIGVVLTEISPEHFERVKFFFITVCQDMAKLVYNTGKDDHPLLEDLFGISQKIRVAQSIYELIAIVKGHSEKVMEILVEKTQIINKEMISQVLVFIKEHYNEDYSIETLAEKVKLSAAYLGKLIKNYTGLTFPQYVTQLRIEKAKILLSDSNSKITDIFEQLGFTNRQNFIRAFKACTGFTPSVYRQSNTEENLKKSAM